jgi:hypothetical protein
MNEHRHRKPPRYLFGGAGFSGASRRELTPRTQSTKMKTTHLLVVRFKSSNRLFLKAEFQTKIAAEAAAMAILKANFDRFICEISAK